LEKRGINAQILETIHARLSERRLSFKADTRVEARNIATPGSTESKTGERDPELPSTKKPRQTLTVPTCPGWPWSERTGLAERL